MKSKWSELKPKACKLRKQGNSIRSIEKKLGIPRSTLSGWFKDIELSKKQEKKLEESRLQGLEKARKKAREWHKNQKNKRIKQAQAAATSTLDQIDYKNSSTQELALALLYLGEGSKSDKETSLSSTSPYILRFFVSSMRKLYNLNVDDFNCDLHLRKDQARVGKLSIGWIN